MKVKWVVEVMSWRFEFDDPHEALDFLKTAAKHYVDTDDGKFPVTSVLDLNCKTIEEPVKEEED